MSRWAAYPVRRVTTAKGEGWQVRYRVDGQTRQRTFETKGRADQARKHLEVAGALRWPADTDGWPIEPQSQAAIAATAIRPQGPTFEAYATDWLERNSMRWAPGGRSAHAASVQALSMLLRLTDDDQRLSRGRTDRSIRLDELTLADLERAINDRYRLSFKGKAGAAVRDAALASGTRPPLADASVSTRRTVQAMTICLGMILKKAVAEGLVSEGLWSGVETTKVRQAVLSEVRQVPSSDEVLHLAEVVARRGPEIQGSGSPRGDRFRAAILFAGTSAPRPGEITGLRTADVLLDVENPYVVLRRTVRWYPQHDLLRLGPDAEPLGAGWISRPLKHRAPGVTRKVPIHPLALDAMRDHLKKYAGPEYFFSSARGDGPLNWGNLEAAYWRPACREVFTGDRSFLASMPPKTLRKAALTAMLAAGLNPYVVAAIAGHDPATLMSSYAGIIDQRDILSIWSVAS